MNEEPLCYWLELAGSGDWVLARRMCRADTKDSDLEWYWQSIGLGEEIPDHENQVTARIPVHGPHSQTLPRGWNSAPDWASYLAQDSNGAWNWHEHAPQLLSDPDGAFWHNPGRVEWAVNDDVWHPGPCYRRPE